MTDRPWSLPSKSLTDADVPGYRVLQRLGEGGMGDVYEAEQLEPVRRRVALKVIKAGLDSAEVVARFESERQALALMDHPCIAKVFDAGTTTRGLPFFAMELVAGLPITEHCDGARLDVAERIKLFVQVCEGVQHAHQKAVIHRDLKPSNVLVTMVDDRPVPKIIDFGVAKALSRPLTERTMFTELGQLLGTPEYMSPEQAELSGSHIDTRSDVYSLGVLLYELLVGALPFDPTELRRAGFDEIRRHIREQDPPRPSTRISRHGGPDTDTWVLNRRSTLHRLSGDLRGDLDWITMKALEKDRARRYGSASELAADLERHLRHEPVLAGPPGSLYRLRKFVRRHRFGVATAAAGLLAAAGFALQTVRQNSVIAAERDRARREARKATSVNTFLQDMLAAAQPRYAQGRDVTVREVVDQAARTLRTTAPEPAVAAALHGTLGRTFRAVGELTAAREHLQRSLALAGAEPDAGEAQLADVEIDLAIVCYEAGDYARAAELAAAARDRFTAVAGAESEPVARCRTLQAQLLYNRGDLPGSIAEHRQVLELRQRLTGADSLAAAEGMRRLGFVLEQAGQAAEATELTERSLAILRREHGDVHPDVVSALLDLADAHHDQGHLDQAEAALREALTTARKLHGDRHPSTANCLWRLGNLLLHRGDLDGAEAPLKEALAVRRAVLTEPHYDIATSLSSLGQLHMHREQLAEAEALLREALAMRRQVFGDDHVAVASSLEALAILDRRAGRPQQAAVHLDEAIQRWRSSRGPDSLDEAGSVTQLALVQQDQKDYAAAETCFRDALRIYRLRHPPDHAMVGQGINNLASLLFRRGAAEESERMLREALAIRRRALDRGHPALLESLGNLAFVLDARQAFAEAEPLYREALAMSAERLPPEHPSVLAATARLANNLVGQQRRAEAEPLLLQVHAAQVAAGAAPAARRRTLQRLVDLYSGWDRAADLARWQAELDALPEAAK